MSANLTISVIFEDEYLIIANKPAGLVVNSEEEVDNLRELLSKQIACDLYVTHRIDQVVSGICLLAKSKEVAAKMNKLFQSVDLDKKYLAVVSSGKAESAASIKRLILHDKKRKKAFVNERLGKEASLFYTKLMSSDRYDLLEIEIVHGRFHQIRCLLANVGMPIKGDVKYGFKRGNKGRFIHLHANCLTFRHPFSGAIVSFSAPLPSETLWQFFNTRIQGETS
ncbi:RluA family pseudouridine synthase [Saprospiraceae bacterium]|nr:RluA family pseudouridine synthase [Saprospiraceae bacterium]